MSYQTFTSSGSWVCPSGVTRAKVKAVGAGGGGGGSHQAGSLKGGGGGGGAWSSGLVTVVPTSSYTVTVGIGGAGGINGSFGDDGGDTIFLLGATVKIKAAAGKGGTNSADESDPGLGGDGGSNADCTGTTKNDGGSGQDGTGENSGGSPGTEVGNGTLGGANNDNKAQGANGGDGVNPGEGGSGGGRELTGNPTDGGDGADGWLYIEWYKDNEVVNIISNA